jgi:aspartate kinase
VSVGLLALALQAQGVQAVSYGGWQVPIETDSAFTKARISRIDDARVRADLAAGKVVIITGFQGIDPTATSPRWARRQRHLGRGRGRGAEGRRVPDLHRRGRRLHHRPAHRARGAPPEHHQLRRDAGDGQPGQQGAADPLGGVCRQVPVPLRVLSSFTPWDIDIDEEAKSGTLITFEEDEKMEQAVVSGIAFNRDEAKITVMGVPDKPGIAYQILGPVADANIDIDVIIQNVSHDGRTDFSFTVHRNDYQRTLDLLKTTGAAGHGAAGDGRPEDLQGVASWASACAATWAWPARCSARSAKRASTSR